MGKLRIASNKFITLLTFIAIFSACSNRKSSKAIKSSFFLDSKTYPKARVYQVTLFTLDTLSNIQRDSLKYIGRPGFVFIDSNGAPTTKNIHSYHLDSSQITKLENFLVDAPCEGKIVDKGCEPIFRNVYIFYNQNGKPIAQVHICFHCEMTYFFPGEDYLCNFDNKVNFKALQHFTESIKN